MAAPGSKKNATYEDLCAVPAHLVAELVDGELHVNPRPASPHVRTASRMGMDLGGPFDGDLDGPQGPGGWWILFEPEVHFGQDVLVPDLAGWRRERLAVIPDVPYFTLPPDWICEVVSPGTESLDRVKKMRVYGREGVPFLWLVNPRAMTLEVYTRTEGGWLLQATHHGAAQVRAAPFAEVALDIGRWWLTPPSPEAP